MTTCSLTKEFIQGLDEPVLIARLFEDGQLQTLDIFSLNDGRMVDWILTYPPAESIRAAKIFPREDRMNYFLKVYYRHVKPE